MKEHPENISKKKMKSESVPRGRGQSLAPSQRSDQLPKSRTQTLEGPSSAVSNCCATFIAPEGSVHGERANFGGLVLGCIDASDSESKRIFQACSRFTRFSPLRTALNPKLQQKTCQIFAK